MHLPFFHTCDGTESLTCKPCGLVLADLPPALVNGVQEGSFRGNRDPLDVICLLKKYICDPMLSQQPLLVIPREKASGWEILPSTKCLE